MGEKPQHVLTRFLIKKFFQKYRPSAHKGEVENAYNEMKSCFEKHGFMSEKCTQEIGDLDFHYENTLAMHKAFDELHLDRYVISELNPPSYHKLRKGRYKDLYTGPRMYADSLYDGIIMSKDRR